MKVADQLKCLLLGTEQVVTEAELTKKLESARVEKRPLRVKLGCDPTAPDLHLGHSVVLAKLRQFQDLGHQAVLIIGDYTALIGDPTGQNKTRPMLTDSAIEQNAKTYFDQAGKILDTSPDKLEIRRNSEWLAKMSFADVIRLASQMSVARMLERDTFAKRHKAGITIGTHEFLYPLMQGYDSVMIRADVELGGTDQTFNNLVGRDLQKDAGQEPQVVMILPILEGLDGTEKMSKSKGNYIGLTDPPNDMFGKTMSISDHLLWRWWQLLFGKTDADLVSMKQDNPMVAKKQLAHAIVERFHGRANAEAAQNHFEKQFSKKELSEIATPLPLANKEISLLEFIESAQRGAGDPATCDSRSEIRRLISQGGIQLDGAKLTDPNSRLTPRDGQILRVGKRLVVRVKLQ